MEYLDRSVFRVTVSLNCMISTTTTMLLLLMPLLWSGASATLDSVLERVRDQPAGSSIVSHAAHIRGVCRQVERAAPRRGMFREPLIAAPPGGRTAKRQRDQTTLTSAGCPRGRTVIDHRLADDGIAAATLRSPRPTRVRSC
jgi:hypothetical protein